MVYRSVRSVATDIALVAIFSLVGGCAQQRNALQAQSRVNPVTTAIYSTSACPLRTGSVSDTRKGAIDLNCFVFPEINAAYSGGDAQPPRNVVTDRSQLAYAMATTDAVYRNRLTSILIKQSDDICVQELGRLTANEATTNATLSILGTGLSTAAAIVSGELAKSILAGGATLAGASRDHINVHVYRNTIAQAVSQVIASERKTRLSDIQKRYTDSREKWSIDDAIRDVNAYHAQCSFFKGLELLLKAADNNTDLQSYRNERVRQTTLSRIDDNIVRIERTIAALGPNDPNVPTLKSDLAKLIGARVAVDREPDGSDVPPPVGAN